MSRNARIAGVALAAGVLAAAAVMVAFEDRQKTADRPPVSGGPSADPLRDELRRCRSLEPPDAACLAAWEAHRRRFLGQDDEDLRP